MKESRFRLTPLIATAALTFGCFSERQEVSGPIDNELCDSTAGNVVKMRDLAFQPQNVTVAAGTEVTWVNCDAEGHTTTSDDPGWDSELLSRNQTFSVTFDDAGTFPYHCTPHAGFMRGSVTVQ
jgi:plastocyanin